MARATATKKGGGASKKTLPKPTKIISLNPPALILYKRLLSMKADVKAVDLTDKREALPELVRKNVVKLEGGAPGIRGMIRVVVPETHVTQSTRKPRGSGDSTDRQRQAPNLDPSDRPYPEQMNVLLARLEETETRLNEERSREINQKIAGLTKELNDYAPGSQDYLRVFAALQAQVQAKVTMAKDIRESAFRQVAEDRHFESGKYLRLLRPEHPPRD